MTDEPEQPADGEGRSAALAGGPPGEVGDATPRRTRIVVATEDVAAAKMAGPAIRAWNLADSLSHEHDVVLATPQPCDLTHPRFRLVNEVETDFRETLEWCDVLVFQGWTMWNRPYVVESDKVMVVDIYDPMHLEQLEQAKDHGPAARQAAIEATTAVLNQQLARGDFFFCASETQRTFWLGQLAALGRINAAVYDADPTLRSFVDVVPFGLEPEIPAHSAPAMRGAIDGIGPDDKVVLWGGGVYNWFDPLTLVRAVDRLKERVPEVRLVFMGMTHPNPGIPKMRMAHETVQLSDELGLTGKHVFFNDTWVALDERHNFLLESDVAVATHFDGLETDFAFRTRILDCMWSSLPVVATEGGALSDLVAERGLGTTVPSEDVDALVDALERHLVDAEFNEACRERMRAVREEYRWDVVARPLLEFCRDPHRAPDLLDPELTAAMDRLRGLGQAASAELDRPFRRGVYRKVAVAARMADDHGMWFTVRHFGRSLWTSVTTRWERTFG